MSEQKAVLLRLARDLNEGRASDVQACFAKDFRLHDPSAPEWPRGHEGARKMLDAFLAFGSDLTIEICDMVEEDDKIAVRWRAAAKRDGNPVTGSIVAIYRFVGGLIAEDWGVAVRAPWPE